VFVIEISTKTKNRFTLAVGKTSILFRYKGEAFNPNLQTTIGAGSSVCSV
jgi:hypothetical protein